MYIHEESKRNRWMNIRYIEFWCKQIMLISAAFGTFIHANQHVSKIWNLSSFAPVIICTLCHWYSLCKYQAMSGRWNEKFETLDEVHRLVYICTNSIEVSFHKKSFNSLSHQCHIFFIVHVVMNRNSISLSHALHFSAYFSCHSY